MCVKFSQMQLIFMDTFCHSKLFTYYLHLFTTAVLVILNLAELDKLCSSIFFMYLLLSKKPPQQQQQKNQKQNPNKKLYGPISAFR